MSAQADMAAPMNTAHQHAANAEDFFHNGLLIPASEAHAQAAEAYLTSADRTSEPSAKRTLLMLHNEHKKASSELERKILKLREDGKDPTVPQKRDVPSKSHFGDSGATGSSRTSSPPLRPPMMDSHEGTVDESFMLLGGQRSDPGDAFNNWWNTVQNKFDIHSQAVAFASAPLGLDSVIPPRTATPPFHKELARDSSLSSDTDLDEPIVSKLTRRFGLTKDSKSKASSSSPLKTAQRQSTITDDIGEKIFDEGDELSESFFLIPLDAEPSASSLKKENTTLKSENETLRRRLEAAEKVLQVRKEQDVQLRDSVYQATREIAQRTMGTSVTLQRQHIDATLNTSPLAMPGYQTARESQYARRVKELEDELRALRVENEKHKAMIVKFRDQWEKLKESAKRKKEAKKAAAATTSSVKEGIPEEPEPEGQ
ncbi:hypothetical protein CPB85DRAFT_1271190 [Mucidula mucida]|nr:hypothetical protein CPB85DRAFT_1271190 [Mucidula mucida]